MRLVIGKKPPSQVRDNNGRIIRGTMEFSGLFPEWLTPNPYKLEFEMNTQALLHYFEGILTRSALSRVTGINERQLGHYATGHRNPRPAQRMKIIEGIHQIGREFNSVI